MGNDAKSTREELLAEIRKLHASLEEQRGPPRPRRFSRRTGSAERPTTVAALLNQTQTDPPFLNWLQESHCHVLIVESPQSATLAADSDVVIVQMADDGNGQSKQQAEMAGALSRLPILQIVAECPGPCALVKRNLRPFTCLSPLTQRRTFLNTVKQAVDSRRAELDLREIASDHDRLFENAPFGIFRSTREGLFIQVNRTLAHMCGYEAPTQMVAEVNRRGIAETLYAHPEQRPVAVDQALASGKWARVETEYRRCDGTPWLGEAFFRNVPGFGPGSEHLVGFVQDITERHRHEDLLAEYAERQAVLLREVNHRVKNNLTAILAILNRELDAVKEAGNRPRGVELLKDLIGRIQGLSTVHAMLSQKQWRPLRVDELCHRVIWGVLRSVKTSKQILVEVSPHEALTDSTPAHHLTLVLNELATNSLKHATRNRPDLHISVQIEQTKESVRIVFRDDGPGFPPQALRKESAKGHIGLELVEGIVGHSLNGTTRTHNDNGAVVEIQFPLSSMAPTDGSAT